MSKKIVVSLILMMLLMGGIARSQNIDLEKNLLSSNVETKDWTVMIYADQDFAHNASGIINLFSRSMASTETVNVVVLADSNPEPANIWYIDQDSNKLLAKELGEINMGNYTSLRDFIDYCKQNLTADRYMTVLWDHGMAWKGACQEITNVSGKKDYLTMQEIQNALKESGGVNIIGFSACEMGCIESVYELRNYTEVYFGSEEMNGYGSWPWKDIPYILTDSSGFSTYELSKQIMDAFKDDNPFFGGFGYWMRQLKIARFHQSVMPWLTRPHFTMSAVKTNKLEGLITAVDNFSKVLIENIDSFGKTITFSRFRSEDFPVPMSIFPPIIMGDQVDLYHFVDLMDKLRYRLLKPELHKAAQNVKEHLEETIVAEHHQIGHRKAHGLSIYFPSKKSDSYDSSYSNSNLDFTNETHWDEFLELYLL